MNKIYEHQGKPFTKQIAVELIFKTYVAAPPIDHTTLREKVYQIHEAGGELPPKVRHLNPVTASSTESEQITAGGWRK